MNWCVIVQIYPLITSFQASHEVSIQFSTINYCVWWWEELGAIDYLVVLVWWADLGWEDFLASSSLLASLVVRGSCPAVDGGTFDLWGSELGLDFLASSSLAAISVLSVECVLSDWAFWVWVSEPDDVNLWCSALSSCLWVVVDVGWTLLVLVVLEVDVLVPAWFLVVLLLVSAAAKAASTATRSVFEKSMLNQCMGSSTGMMLICN